jgi:hypothetical protein
LESGTLEAGAAAPLQCYPEQGDALLGLQPLSWNKKTAVEARVEVWLGWALVSPTSPTVPPHICLLSALW